MTGSEYWMVWPANTAVSVLFVLLVAMAFLYAARKPVHHLIGSLGFLISGPLRIGARWLLAAANDMTQRNKAVLLAHGRQEVEQRIEREFERLGAIVTRDLQGYPALQRKLLDEITRVEEDYKKCGEVPPPPPDWVEAVTAMANVKSSGNEMVQRVLEEINRSVTSIHDKALVDYRRAYETRHKILEGFMPFWRSLDKTMAQVDKKLTGLQSSTAAVDAHMEKFEQINAKTDKAEHATLHLLYARFWHKVLYDAGHVSTKEPFQRLVHQGMIHKRSFRDVRGKYHYEDDVEERGGAWVLKGTDERVDASLEKMSKSKYNVVNPDDMCAQHGADAMRLYELFMGPIEDGTEWDTTGVAGTRRFLDRAWRLLIDPETDTLSTKITTNGTSENRELERALHAAIKKVTQSITDLRFNTAIAEMMIFVNEATKAPAIPRDWLETFVKILSPFAPHLAEEMWQRLGHTQTVADAPWPAYDEAKLAPATMVLVVQVNGKVRGQIEVAPDASDATILTAARVDRNVQSFLGGKQIKREIYVKGRLVNLVA